MMAVGSFVRPFPRDFGVVLTGFSYFIYRSSCYSHVSWSVEMVEVVRGGGGGGGFDTGYFFRTDVFSNHSLCFLAPVSSEPVIVIYLDSMSAFSREYSEWAALRRVFITSSVAAGGWLSWW